MLNRIIFKSSYIYIFIYVCKYIYKYIYIVEIFIKLYVILLNKNSILKV